MKIRITGRGIWGRDGELTVGSEHEISGTIPAGWLEKVSAVGEMEGAVALTNLGASDDALPDLYQAAMKELEELKAAAGKEYLIGNLTMERVFRPSGLTDVSDMQTVFDAVEAALSATVSPEGSTEGADPKPASEIPTREGIAAMEKAEVLEWLDAHGWDGDKRLGVEKLRDALTEIVFIEA